MQIIFIFQKYASDQRAMSWIISIFRNYTHTQQPFFTVNRVFQHKDYSGKIHKTLILNCSQRCFSVGKKSLLANFYFLQPNCTYFKAINQKCGTCIYLNIIILVKQLAGNELFILQYSLCCAKTPNGIISVEFIEWERTNRKLHTFIFLIVTWDQIL